MILTGEQEKTGNIQHQLESVELHKYILMEFIWINSQEVFKIGKIFSILYIHLNQIKISSSKFDYIIDI